MANIVQIESEGAPPKEPLEFDVRYVEVPIEEIKGRLVRNPNYGGEDAQLYGWKWIPVEPTTRKPKFHAALRDSLQREGMRNPMVGYATPEGVFLTFGSSRLRCARDVEMATVPMIINDFAGRFASAKLVTQDNWAFFFEDVPARAAFTPTGFDYHYALERNRRSEFDSAGLNWAEGVDDFTKDEFSWIYE